LPWTQILRLVQPAPCVGRADPQALLEHFAPILGADLVGVDTLGQLAEEVVLDSGLTPAIRFERVEYRQQFAGVQCVE
jgi:hypothetical protein